jgi:glycosyltransferase involved in cell wall biosynthesis
MESTGVMVTPDRVAVASLVANMVSTIVPVFNRPDMLREAVHSVVVQTHRPIEIIIVDDGSTDRTAEVCRELQAQYGDLVRCLHAPHAGTGAARNRGLAAARGEFVQYLDSDDLLLPQKLARQIAELRRHPESGVCYCMAHRPDSRDGRRISHRTDERFTRILPAFLHRRGWPTLAPLWTRWACDAIGPWAALSVMEDWEYDCRAGVLGIGVVYTPEALCVVRDHADHRASGLSSGYDQRQWADYLTAHESVYAHLQRADQLHHLRDVPFAKNLFRSARACAAVGYDAEARRAYDLAVDACHRLPDRLKLSGFRVCASVIGWRSAARILESVHQAVPGGAR